MKQSKKIHEAAQILESRLQEPPRIAVILGSGLGAFADQVVDPVRTPYASIPHFPLSRVSGHAGELVVGSLGERVVAVMSGRAHYYEGHSMADLAIPVRTLAAIGVERLIVTNASGGINRSLAPGSFMAIRDHLNLMGDNPLVGVHEPELGARFPDMTEAYCTAGLAAARSAAAAIEIELHEGIYAGVRGPSYETPAEIEMLRRLGADAVGMSTVPEVIAARQAELQVAGVSLVTNAAAGISDHPLSHGEVKKVAESSRQRLLALLTELVERFAQAAQ